MMVKQLRFIPAFHLQLAQNMRFRTRLTVLNHRFLQKPINTGGNRMREGKYIIGMFAIAVLATVIIIGCGVDSGVRDGNTPGYTGTPGLPGGVSNPGSNPDSAGDEERKVFEMVNEEREKAGVSQLEWCDGLAALAKAHSCDMCDRGFFAHINPEGEAPPDRARLGHAGSYTFTPIVPDPYFRIAENIARGNSTAEQTMQQWMNSSGHRAQILNGANTHLGVGQCDGCGKHWTQNFGTRNGGSGGGSAPPPGGGGGGKG
jgi:uncharacterized protein YkwD